MGCVGHRTVAVVFGIFVVTFERVRARLYCYGSKRLTQRSHLTFISSFGSPNSKDSLAGSAFPPYVLKASAMNMVGLPSEV